MTVFNLNIMRERLSDFFDISLSCAACGDIADSLGSRLCSSMHFSMPLDVVILMQNDCQSEVLSSIKSMSEKWNSTTTRVGAIFIVSKKNCLNILSDDSIDISKSGQDFNCDDTPVEALLHVVPSLHEYFCVIPEKCINTFSANALDFFTPNGIPLLLQINNRDALSDTHHSSEKILEYINVGGDNKYEPSIAPDDEIYGLRKTLCRQCFLFYQNFLKTNTISPHMYRLAYQQWAYANQMGILYSAVR